MKQLYIFLLCLVAISGKAQYLSHDFQNTSLSEALIWIDNAQENYKLNFIFDELEDFTVTTRLENVLCEMPSVKFVDFIPCILSSTTRVSL